jgi:hypothetical protein
VGVSQGVEQNSPAAVQGRDASTLMQPLGTLIEIESRRTRLEDTEVAELFRSGTWLTLFGDILDSVVV